MGDEYAEALGVSLKKVSRPILVLEMANNRLSSKGMEPIVNMLKPDLTDLDLS